MKIGIDFGITHTDVAISNDQGTKFQTLKSLDMNQDLQNIFDSMEKPENIKKIFVTGGKSSDLPKTLNGCLLYTSPSPRDGLLSRMPSSA